MKETDSARLSFLGTGTSQGVPVIGCSCKVCKSTDPKDKRLRTSALIEYNGVKILIDAGPDFRQQLLRANLSDIDAILLTHEHKDHTGGLDDVRALNYINGAPLPIYCEERVFNSLKLEYSYVFDEIKYPGIPQFDIHIIEDKKFSIKGVEIYPIRVFHYKLPIFGFRIGDIAYITDANRIDDHRFAQLLDLEILVLNTVRTEKHISHFCLSEAIAIAKRSGAKKTYLTHLSHQIGTHKSLSSDLPPGIYAAWDGLTVEL